MNNSQKKIIEMLNAYIHSEKLGEGFEKKISVEDIVKYANIHHISGPVYSILSKDERLKKMNVDVAENFKKDVIYQSLMQITHLKNVSNILKVFKEKNIEVIVLKGLVIRELYQNPNLRIMSDADILVKKNSLGKVSKVLEQLGYISTKHIGDHGAHLVFVKQGCLPIEVHWTLINKDFFNGDTSFEKDIWKRAIPVEIVGVRTLGLGLEDLLLHLIMHMAVHMAHGGFGIRQIVDVVLLVNKKGDFINWTEIELYAKESKIDKFLLVIFNICNNLFDMTIPKEIKQIGSVSNKTVNNLIDDVLDNGVYGVTEECQVFANEISFTKENEKNIRFIVIKKYLSLFFPPLKNMSEKYDYAKKNRLLIPIAHIHHLFEGMFNKNYSLTDKIKILTRTVSKSTRRNKLIKELEL